MLQVGAVHHSKKNHITYSSDLRSTLDSSLYYDSPRAKHYQLASRGASVSYEVMARAAPCAGWRLDLIHVIVC